MLRKLHGICIGPLTRKIHKIKESSRKLLTISDQPSRGFGPTCPQLLKMRLVGQSGLFMKPLDRPRSGEPVALSPRRGSGAFLGHAVSTGFGTTRARRGWAGCDQSSLLAIKIPDPPYRDCCGPKAASVSDDPSGRPGASGRAGACGEVAHLRQHVAPPPAARPNILVLRFCPGAVLLIIRHKIP